MSDGDNATPGLWGPASSSGDEDRPQSAPRLTRSTPPGPGAAPWERAQGVLPPDTRPEAAGTGNHTDGVAVADLIAKLANETTGSGRRRRHAEPEPQPPAEPDPAPEAPVIVFEAPAAHADPGDSDTEVMPVASAYAADLPDLALFTHPGPPTHTASAPPAARRTHHRARIIGRVAAALIAVCALALTGGAWQWQSMKNNSLNKVSALDLNSRDIVDPTAQFGDENFLIVGVDSRIGANSGMGAGSTDDAAGARSDTVMLVNIPANRKRVVAVSFPRDLAINPVKCQAWDPSTGQYGPVYDEQTGEYGPDEVYTETKLNSAYAFGGPKCLVKVIQKLSGLSINRFMAVDFAGFAKMVDALGGVEVCSTTPLEDYELGTVLSNAGRQMVDGHTALQYVRARQVTTEVNGDYGRIKRQQLFLSSLLRSLISKDTFFSLSKLNNVVNMFIQDSYVDNIKTKDLVDLGQSIQGVNAGRISFITVPTTGETDADGNEPPRTDDVHALFDAIINDDPLPEERNADNTPVPPTPAAPSAPSPATGEVVDAVATDPSLVTVRVSNSTGENGLAADAATALQQHGFNVDTPDDYPGPLDSTTVFFAPGNEQAAATVASSFSNATMERSTGLGEVVRVVLGSDYRTVAPPSPSGSAVQVHLMQGTAAEPTHLPEDLTVTNAADTTCE
ncbi:LCP family protein [Mycobacterium sp. BMJ-28]